VRREELRKTSFVLANVFYFGTNNLAIHYWINIVRYYMANDFYTPDDILGNKKVFERVGFSAFNKQRQRINSCFER